MEKENPAMVYSLREFQQTSSLFAFFTEELTLVEAVSQLQEVRDELFYE
jgi:hypothetical protein